MDKLIDIEGWAGAYKGRSYIYKPRNEKECRQILKKAKQSNLTVNPVGSKVSFGDMVVNQDMIVVDNTQMNKILSWDETTATLTVESGVSIYAILVKLLPLGWLIASIPGSLKATIGGCVANNVHGKDSLKSGNFGRHVEWIDLMLHDGSIIKVSKKEKVELFNATVGGFGLTGIILKVAIKLYKIPSLNVLSQSFTCNNIEEIFFNIINEKDCDYIQSWVDASQKGDNLGRGIVMKAKFENQGPSFSQNEILRSLKENDKILNLISSYMFWRTLRPLFHYPLMYLTNYLYFTKTKITKNDWKKILFSKYFFFHNNIPNFYSVYNPPGFIEIQALLPKEEGSKGFEKLIKTSQKKEVMPVLSGMKRTIKDDFLISFQEDGASISFDIPLKSMNLKDLEKKVYPVYAKIAELGGKVNISKDQIMPKHLFCMYYPKWEKFWQIKSKYDPNKVFSNDMARRLFPF